MSVFNKAHFYDEEAAFKMVEALLWPDGPVCPYCGGKDRIYVLEGVRSKPSKKNPEGIVRHGLKKCGHCRKQFTVRVKTIFESSHIPLHKWLQAIHLLCASKKGISSHQLHRILEITYEAAWFMSHRIREAMRTDSLAPMGGPGSVYEIDETFIGQKHDKPKKRGYGHKHAALALVERDLPRGGCREHKRRTRRWTFHSNQLYCLLILVQVRPQGGRTRSVRLGL